VRLGAADDLARLARFLAGRAVGVVFGGGGARGMAHIGVVRALEEAGVPIDRVGGTSIGAVIAGQVARGYSWQEMLELNRRGWVEMAPQKVYTLPLISVLSRAKADVMLEMMYGDDLIEDLWRGYFCVSTNLTRTEVVVHRRGMLRHWIAASMTIPGVTPPIVSTGGDLLVDGGVLNNLPVDVMRRLADGPIVAIDVSAAVDLRADPSWRETPGPWRYLASAVRRQKRPFPNILRLVSRAALLASDVYAKQLKRDTELYLDIPMEEFDFFDMDAIDRLVDFGYEWTRAELARADLSWLPPRSA
jgi:predicted acylesterase/phospholipase RssA